MKLHELSVKRPVAVTMAVLVFVVIGLYSLTMLPMEMMPEMDLSMAIVYTSYPNVGSDEVENLVTKNVESAVASVSGIESITSQSSEGSSMVMIEFSNSVDIDDAVQNVSDSIDMVSAMLPDGAEDPMIIKLNSSMMSAAMMSVSYEGYDLVQTKKFVEDNVEDKLKAAGGVASVNISGGTDRIIEVTVDPQKLYGYNLSVSDISQAMAAQNRNLPAGATEGMNKDMSVRTVGKFGGIEDIENVPISTATGEIIYLRDVAVVTDTYSEASTYSRLNGKESISISVNKESDANTVDVVNGIKNALEEIKAQNSKFSYEMIMEQASYIENAINSVAQNAVMGGLLAIIILLLFLGSIRTSLVIGISMPISIITTFIGMYFSGMTLNVVSLGGLALGVGMLVDNSVVVLENIFRRRSEVGEDSRTASMSGAGEVIGAVVASVLTTCIVYVPILFIDNMMAVMFKQLAFTIIFSQLASLLTTFLLVPMLSSKIKNLQGGSTSKLGFLLRPFEKMLSFFYIIYEKALRTVLKHRKLTITVTLGVFVLCMAVLGGLGMTLMPSSDEGMLSVSISLPPGSKLEQTDEITRSIEKILEQHEDVETISANVGSGGMAGMMGGTSGNTASVTVTLNDDRKKTTNEVVAELREQMKDITGAEISLESSNTSMSMSSEEVQFNFTGADEDSLQNYVLEAEKLLAGIDGVVETETSMEDTQYELRVKLNSAKAAKYGMTTSTVANLVKSVLNDTTASEYTESGMEYDINIVYPENYVKDYNDLKTLRIKTMTGQWVALSDIADVTVEQGSTTLQRVDQKRVYTLKGKIYGSNMGQVNNEFEKKLAGIDMPDGVSRESAGSFQVMIDAMKSLVTAIFLGILLMYMIMCAQFENLKQPFIILFTVPLALIGVVLALALTASPLSVVGCIGILMLVGIIVNNAIVLIDFVNTAIKEHPEMTRTDILVYAGKTRMRPILMTSLTSILGFLPMALSRAEGSEMMQPLAVVLCGGLFVGTFLTLLFIPTLYASFDEHALKKERKKLKKAAKKKQPEEVM
ncbi:MAG: efflux RND transporter permease subunit [Clostridia bacterium]|nr:efflux RND transporter permease subunit [Clostridia bacterium]